MKKKCCGVVIMEGALEGLKPGGMLQDDVINVYMATLSASFDDVGFMSSYVVTDMLVHSSLRNGFKASTPPLIHL